MHYIEKDMKINVQVNKVWMQSDATWKNYD